MPRTWMLLPLVACRLLAQSSGLETSDLEGRVLTSGRPGSGIHVLLEHVASGRRWEGRTSSEGRFAWRFLPPGVYRLSATEGTGAKASLDVPLQPGARHRVTLPLTPMEVVEVTATGATPLRTQGETQVTPEDLLSLPVARRNYQDLALVSVLAAPGRGPVTGGAPDSRLSFLGASPRQNTFLLDGLDNNDLGNGSLRMPIPQEAIQGFQVLAGGFGVELGRAAGGAVNAVSRSGGNTFSGSAFTYARTGTLDAQPALGPTTEDLRLVQTGLSAGGPLVPDRVFWFVAAERLDQRDRRVVNLSPELAAVARLQGFRVDLGGLPADESVASAFARVDAYTGDHALTATLAWSVEHNESQIPWGGLVARSAGGRRDTRGLALGLTHRWVLSEALVNEARVSYATRDNALRSLEDPGQVSVVVQGAGTFGSQMLAPQTTQATTWQLTDTLTGTAGAHTWKAGFDLVQSLNRGRLEDTYAGYYLFAAIPELGLATSAMAFMAPNPFGGSGLPVAFLQKFGDPSTRFQGRSLGLFLQDEWRPSPTFSLRLGLRWDRQAFPAFDEVPDYAALRTPPAAADPLWGPVRLPDDTRAFSALLTPATDWTVSRLAPRASFQWDVQPELRLFGGVGVFTGPVNLGPIFGLRIQNGTGTVSVLRTVLDDPMVGPWIAWASADGLAVNRRYGAPPAGTRMLVIPGAIQAPRTTERHLGLAWQPRPTLELMLEGFRTTGTGLLNLRDVNAYVPFGPAARRPDLRYGSVYRADASGESRAWSLALTTRWRPSPAFHLEAAYARGQAEDNYVDWTGAVAPQDTFDPAQEWGPSYQSQRHRFVVQAQWRSGPWTLAALGRVGSGRPLPLLVGYDRNLNGDASSDRPAGVGRNRLETPWTRILDLRLARTLTQGPRKLELVLDVFNAFNRANVLDLQNSLASTTPPPGTPTAYAPMRQLQLGLRFGW